MHQLINHKIIYKNIINQEWVTAIGVDQFIYLNGYTISEYLTSIQPFCTQVIFPWSFCCYNNTDSKIDNFLENISLYHNTYKGYAESGSGASNGMVRTKNLLALHDDSHSFISKTPRQIIFIVNEYYYGMPNILTTTSIFKIANEKLDTTHFYNLKISSFHIILRNVNEYFIKSIFGYSECVNNSKYLYLLSECIKDNSRYILDLPIQSNRLPYMLNIKDNPFVDWSINLKIPVIENKNSTEYYENIISSGLGIYGITKKQYNNWKKYVLSG
jgi:hypothetical protein